MQARQGNDKTLFMTPLSFAFEEAALFPSENSFIGAFDLFGIDIMEQGFDLVAETPQPARTSRGPRLYHKKSRLGCLRCKSRRVKCDEKRPSCSGCTRHAVDCVYEVPTGNNRRLRSSASGTSSVNSDHSSDGKHTLERQSSGNHQRRRGRNFDPLKVPQTEAVRVPSFLPEGDIVLDLPESHERRMWELRLMANYTQMLARQRITATHPRPSFLWWQEIISAAFENDGALYAVFAHSAFNMWTVETDPAVRERLDELRRTYLTLALREHQAGIQDLNIDTADAVCMTSLALLGQLFAQVQLVPTDPWEPPLEWMRIGKGTGAVFEVTKVFLEKLPDSRWQRFVSSIPKFDADEIFSPKNREHLLWLLDPPEGSGDREFESKVAQNAYQRVLSYVGWVQKAVQADESYFSIMRRMGALTMFMPDIFAEYCAQRRPRALVVLAWFFENGISIDHLWNLNGTGKRQVRAIYHTLPEEWRCKVKPLIDKHRLEEAT